jgi:hypothetical protein
MVYCIMQTIERRVTTENPLRCAALTKAGQPCRAFVTQGDTCMMHGPRGPELHRLGGAATANRERSAKLLPGLLRPVVEELLAAFREVHAKQLDPSRATAMAALASAICRTFTVGLVEERLTALEQQAAQAARDRGRWTA